MQYSHTQPLKYGAFLWISLWWMLLELLDDKPFWQVNRSLPLGNKPLPELMLTTINMAWSVSVRKSDENVSI